MENMKTITLDMGDASVELHMTKKLIEDIKTAFSLSSDDQISERHVKYYLVSGMKNALRESDDEGTA